MTDIPAGWYPDPATPGSGTARWWSGAAWTEHIRSVVADAVVVEAAPRIAATALPAAPWAHRVALPRTAPAPAIGSPNTPGIWLLASTPLVANLVLVTAGIVAALTGIPLLVSVGYLATLAYAWIAAGLDRRALRGRGYAPPSIFWMLLLPPLVYFIRRGRVVRAMGQRAWPPELAYFIQIVLGVICGVALGLFSRGV